MQCYRDGGCGPYEGRACNECPASKPDYKQRHKAKTDKPLKAWTLWEVQEYCRKTECEDCIFDTDAPEVSRCPMAGNPSAWSFIRNPRFTQQEVERAKNLLEVVGNGELKQVGDMTTLRVDGKIIYLRKGAFPSMKPEQAINLDEIIGGAQ